MPKQLIVLCDGTSNSPESDRGRETNVQLLRKFLGSETLDQSNNASYKYGWEIDQYDVDGSKQIVYYDRGLGAPKLDRKGNVLKWSLSPKSFFKNSQYVYSKFREAHEQITARGIIDNVAQAYNFLVHNYEPGDKIFMFGFSRGAYTLRLLETMIRYIGLINKNGYDDYEAIEDAIERGFSLYNMQVHPNNNPEVIEFRKNCYSHEGIIHFYGLWDTVRGLVKEKVHSDAKISSAVNISRHALAIDEQRAIFKPEIWVAKPGADSQQLWFAGVHCDIGGGYIERGLANIALQWMITEAYNNGLWIGLTILNTSLFKPEPLAMQSDSLRANIQEDLKLTWEKVGGIYRRPVAQMTASERLHETVLVRYGKTVKRDATEITYQPSNLTHTLIAYRGIRENYSPPFTEELATLKIPDPDTLSDVGEDTSLVFANKGLKP